MILLKYSVGELYRYSRLPEDEPVAPRTLVEAKMTKPKLSYFDHIMRKQGSLENAIMLGKIEGGKKKRLSEYKMY